MCTGSADISAHDTERARYEDNDACKRHYWPNDCSRNVLPMPPDLVVSDKVRSRASRARSRVRLVLKGRRYGRVDQARLREAEFTKCIQSQHAHVSCRQQECTWSKRTSFLQVLPTPLSMTSCHASLPCATRTGRWICLLRYQYCKFCTSLVLSGACSSSSSHESVLSTAGRRSGPFPEFILKEP
jgi:hypothetical protein